MRPLRNTLFRLPAYVILLTLICVSCSTDRNERQINSIQIGSDALSGFPMAASVDTLLSVPVESDVTVYYINGKICKVFFKKNDRNLKLEIWDCKGVRCLYEYGSEERLLMPFVTRSWDSFIIHDRMLLKTVVINIEEAVNIPCYTPESKPSNIESSRILPWKDRQVFLNGFSFLESVPRVCFSDKKWNYTEKKNYKFNSSNVVHGELICKKDYSKIAYVPSNDNNIEILDEKGRKKTVISFYHEKKQDIAANEIDGITFYAYKFPAVLCFSKAAPGTASFIAGYIDDNENQSIVTIDWEGNILTGFKVNGAIKQLSYSEDENRIYSFEQIGDNNYLIVYNNPSYHE